MKTLLGALLAILFLANGFVVVFCISCRQLPSNPDACCKVIIHSITIAMIIYNRTFVCSFRNTNERRKWWTSA